MINLYQAKHLIILILSNTIDTMQTLPIIQPHELLALPKENLILIDASAGAQGRDNYQKQHLTKALYVDLDIDLAHVPENAANGGRHPLPTPQNFGILLGRVGISAQSHVVVYDDKNGANAAARFFVDAQGSRPY